MPRRRREVTAAEAQAATMISAKIHQYVDQADPAQARRGLQFVCAQGLFGETFVEFLDAELLALRRRLQVEGVLDAEGHPMNEAGDGCSLRR